MTKNLYVNLLIYSFFVIIIGTMYLTTTEVKHPLVTIYLMILALAGLIIIWPETKIKQLMNLDKLKGLEYKSSYYLKMSLFFLVMLIIGLIIYFVFKVNQQYSAIIVTLIIAPAIATFSSLSHSKAAKRELRLLIEKNNTTPVSRK